MQRPEEIGQQCDRHQGPAPVSVERQQPHRENDQSSHCQARHCDEQHQVNLVVPRCVTCPMQTPTPKFLVPLPPLSYGMATTAAAKELGGVPGVNTFFTQK